MGEAFVIETRDLRKMYGPHLALEDVDVQIPQGAIGILGPNGAGKSTFFKCILGLITTTSGEGSVLGYDIKTQGDIIRSRIGYMPEYDSLDPDLNAIDQVRYAGELLGMNPAAAMQRESTADVPSSVAGKSASSPCSSSGVRGTLNDPPRASARAHYM